jgi:hypothetical protein
MLSFTPFGVQIWARAQSALTRAQNSKLVSSAITRLRLLRQVVVGSLRALENGCWVRWPITVFLPSDRVCLLSPRRTPVPQRSLAGHR